MTTVLVRAGILAVTLWLAVPVVARAQVGNVNPAALSPSSTAVPFGNDPHPFNNFHMRQPWSVWGYTLREFVVAQRVVVVPMEVAQPGSLPPMIEWQTVTLPGYGVRETTRGFIVQEHWGLETRGNAYYWTWKPTQYRSK